MKDEEARLDQLLAGGSLGGPRYDEIFERVVPRTAGAEAGRPRRWRRWWLVMSAALVPAAAAWLVLARPKGPPPTPKGAAGLSGAIELGCGVAAGHVCRAGDTLLFSVNSAVASGYLAAYAERIGDPSSERIWYFPRTGGRAPLVSAGQATVVLPEGIRIGPEHTPGRYRVTAWITQSPPSRAAGTVDLEARTHDTFELTVIP